MMKSERREKDKLVGVGERLAVILQLDVREGPVAKNHRIGGILPGRLLIQRERLLEFFRDEEAVGLVLEPQGPLSLRR